jgi:hypothetical protein
MRIKASKKTTIYHHGNPPDVRGAVPAALWASTNNTICSFPRFANAGRSSIIIISGQQQHFLFLVVGIGWGDGDYEHSSRTEEEEEEDLQMGRLDNFGR